MIPAPLGQEYGIYAISQFVSAQVPELKIYFAFAHRFDQNGFTV
jgi:hypothetical protein